MENGLHGTESSFQHDRWLGLFKKMNHRNIQLTHKGAALLAIVLGTSIANANTVTRVATSTDQPNINQPFVLTFTFASANNVACGMSIDWGNGKVDRLRFGEGQQVTAPFAVEHVYSAPGQYKVKISGEGMIRGLRSLLPCDVKREGVVTVVDPVEIARVAEEKAAEERAQLARREEEERAKRARQEEQTRIAREREETARAEREKAAVAAEAEKRRLEKEYGDYFQKKFFGRKWSIGNLPCGTNGGTHVTYVNRPPSGDIMILGGKLSQSPQKQDFAFKIMDSRSIEHTHIIYAEGNAGVLRFVRDPATIVSKSVTTYTMTSDNKMDFARSIRSIDIDAMFNGRIRYEDKQERGTRTACN